MSREDYWRDILAESMDEHGVTFTVEQLAKMARDVDGAHEEYGMFNAVPSGPSESERELAIVKDLLKAELRKVVCPECSGSGLRMSHGPCHSSTSQCWKCRGNGRIA